MSSHPPPLISVVTPTYNRSRLLTSAIESIQQQTFTNWELIIIDDASSDETDAVVRAMLKKDARLRYYRQEQNQGPAAARNRAFHLAQGSFIAFQDDDDISMPHRLKTQIDVFRHNPALDLIAPYLQCLKGDTLTPQRLGTDFASFARAPVPVADLACMPFPAPALMGRKNIFFEVPLRPFFPVAEDYDFIIRCVPHFNITTIPDVLYQYRVASDTHRSITTSADRALVVLKYHYAAWVSAYCVAIGQPDPVKNALNVDDVLQQARTSLLKAPRQAKDVLHHKYGNDHLDTACYARDKEGIAHILEFLQRYTTAKDYGHILAHYALRRGDKAPQALLSLTEAKKDAFPLPLLSWLALFRTLTAHAIKHKNKALFLEILKKLGPMRGGVRALILSMLNVIRRLSQYAITGIRWLLSSTGIIKKPLTPKVSVIMPTYNRAHLLPDAIKSLHKQTMRDWELIIIDDNSHDKTRHVVFEFMKHDSRIRYLRTSRNSGPAIARNMGIQAARGRYIALQDDDDLSLPQRLKTQANVMERDSTVDIVATLMAEFNDDTVTPNPYGKGWASQAHALPPIHQRTSFVQVCIGTIMGRRHVFKETPLRPFFRLNEDYDFFMRCIEKYNAVTIPKTLYHYRKQSAHSPIAQRTQQRNFIQLHKYHWLVWISALHRHHAWTDPMDTAQTLNDVARALHPEYERHASRNFCELASGFSDNLIRYGSHDDFQDALDFTTCFGNEQTERHLVADILTKARSYPTKQQDIYHTLINIYGDKRQDITAVIERYAPQKIASMP
ncbi:MAG: glycosyltransferase [Alphaproteobacteria bacterium GM7ARS4]|nr:glycosyltransferase [Alphaproteobacteria bacterium GM7ARS4]